MNERHFLLILAALCYLLQGCGERWDIYEVKMSTLNPTSYTFDTSLLVVKNVILANAERMPVSDVMTTWDSTRTERIPDIKEISGGCQIELCSGGRDSNDSYIFKRRDGRVPYIYRLHLNLVSEGPNKTTVSVITIRPSIIVGISFPNFNSPLVEPGHAIGRDVKPSTIEEYKVLRVIGEALGSLDRMPPLQLPDTSIVIGRID